MLTTEQDNDSAPRGDRLTDAEVAPDRRSYIGGADVAAIVGVNRYASALDVYLKKLGLVTDTEPNEPMEWGNILEPVVAAHYAKREGVTLTKGAFWHGPASFLGGTPDYLVEGQRRGVEVKTAGLRQAAEWGDEDDAIPEHYAIQSHYYLALTGYSRWDVPVLIGGQEFRIYRLHADRELGRSLLDLATEFWTKNIEQQIPPSPDGSDAARDALAKLYKSHRPELLQSTGATDAMAERLRLATIAHQHVEAEKQAAENDLKAIIGEAAGIEGAWGRITWKAAKDSQRIDLKSLRKDPAAVAAVAPHMKSKPGGRRFLNPWSKQSNHEGEE